MARTRVSTALSALPTLQQSLYVLNNDDLKWYAALLPGKAPTRKAELVEVIAGALTSPAEVRRLWLELTPQQREVIAEVVHNRGGVYNPEAMEARFPSVRRPAKPQYAYGTFYGRKKQNATPFDLFFASVSDTGRYIAPEVAALLRPLSSPPPPFQIPSKEEPPTLEQARKVKPNADLVVLDTEAAVFHDLMALLSLVQAGKISVGAATRLPTLGSLRLLSGRLLISDYFIDGEYEKADEAIRPLALVMLAQAANWATPSSVKGSKLELTKSGQALVAGTVGAVQVRDAWERWVKSDLLDELSRIRAIKGQQSRNAHLTKPAERRRSLVTALKSCPVGRWVAFDDLLRYMMAESLLPQIERSEPSALYLGPYLEYGWLGYNEVRYWDVVTGSYLRALLWEYAATLGMVDIAYTRPEDTPHSFGEVYGLEGLDTDYLSRYDGLMAFRLTNLGAYLLGLTTSYTPPVEERPSGPPLLRVLPNLDLVVTDPRKLMPNDRALLERIALSQSEAVYHLSREKILDAAENGATIGSVRLALIAMSGIAEADLPQTVRVFLSDIEKKLDALSDCGRILLLEGDPLVLAEIAYNRQFRDAVQLARIGDKEILLVPEAEEPSVRRQLKKLGYVPRKGPGIKGHY